METQVLNATEYRNVPLALLNESNTNPRRTFEETALKELAESIRSQGVLSPLLVRPLTESGFEIIAGARRYRAAQLAEQSTVPVRIVNLSDAAALEAQLVENLIRAEIHPMEKAQGFRALLNLEDPKYSIEQIAAKVGKAPAFVAQRLKLCDLAPTVVEAFYADSIGVGHAFHRRSASTLLSRTRDRPAQKLLSPIFQQLPGIPISYPTSSCLSLTGSIVSLIRGSGQPFTTLPMWQEKRNRRLENLGRGAVPR
jgi:ParB/RepB/Spo0J family partition protein